MVRLISRVSFCESVAATMFGAVRRVPWLVRRRTLCSTVRMWHANDGQNGIYGTCCSHVASLACSEGMYCVAVVLHE